MYDQKNVLFISLVISLSLLFNRVENIGFKLGDSCKIPSNGTTKNLEGIFRGRCNYFINVQQAFNCDIDPSKYDCDAIWDSFQSIITTKAPCDIKIQDLDNFLKLVNHTIARNTSVFWSGTYTPAHECNLFNFIKSSSLLFNDKFD